MIFLIGKQPAERNHEKCNAENITEEPHEKKIILCKHNTEPLKRMPGIKFSKEISPSRDEQNDVTRYKYFSSDVNRHEKLESSKSDGNKHVGGQWKPDNPILCCLTCISDHRFINHRALKKPFGIILKREK